MQKYEIERVVGQGSFGKALLCRRKSDVKRCIIKQISVSNLSKKELKQTEQESLLLSKLTHPNIVAFWECFLHGGNLNIVMEFADGGDLTKFIKSRKSSYIGEAQVLNLFIQISLAIKHVHDRKIIHRDLKSDNIFLTSSGLIKLGDFGVSRVLKNTAELAATQIGTPYYMSPEIMEGKKYNSKTDIWSLGCILYELLCLRLPFDGTSMRNLAQNIIRLTPSQPPPMYTNDVKELAFAMLNKSSKIRPSITSILSRPVVKRKISDFLNETKMQGEFSHTILHGVNILSDAAVPVISAPPILLEVPRVAITKAPEPAIRQAIRRPSAEALAEYDKVKLEAAKKLAFEAEQARLFEEQREYLANMQRKRQEALRNMNNAKSKEEVERLAADARKALQPSPAPASYQKRIPVVETPRGVVIPPRNSPKISPSPAPESDSVESRPKLVIKPPVPYRNQLSPSPQQLVKASPASKSPAMKRSPQPPPGIQPNLCVDGRKAAASPVTPAEQSPKNKWIEKLDGQLGELKEQMARLKRDAPNRPPVGRVSPKQLTPPPVVNDDSVKKVIAGQIADKNWLISLEDQMNQLKKQVQRNVDESPKLSPPVPAKPDIQQQAKQFKAAFPSPLMSNKVAAPKKVEASQAEVARAAVVRAAPSPSAAVKVPVKLNGPPPRQVPSAPTKSPQKDDEINEDGSDAADKLEHRRLAREKSRSEFKDFIRAQKGRKVSSFEPADLEPLSVAPLEHAAEPPSDPWPEEDVKPSPKIPLPVKSRSPVPLAAYMPTSNPSPQSPAEISNTIMSSNSAAELRGKRDAEREVMKALIAERRKQRQHGSTPPLDEIVADDFVLIRSQESVGDGVAPYNLLTDIQEAPEESARHVDVGVSSPMVRIDPSTALEYSILVNQMQAILELPQKPDIIAEDDEEDEDAFDEDEADELGETSDSSDDGRIPEEDEDFDDENHEDGGEGGLDINTGRSSLFQQLRESEHRTPDRDKKLDSLKYSPSPVHETITGDDDDDDVKPNDSQATTLFRGVDASLREGVEDIEDEDNDDRNDNDSLISGSIDDELMNEIKVMSCQAPSVIKAYLLEKLGRKSFSEAIDLLNSVDSTVKSDDDEEDFLLNLEVILGNDRLPYLDLLYTLLIRR